MAFNKIRAIYGLSWETPTAFRCKNIPMKKSKINHFIKRFKLMSKNQILSSAFFAFVLTVMSSCYSSRVGMTLPQDYDEPNVNVIVTHGIPYYSNGVLSYYYYNGRYYYPHQNNGRWYFRHHRRPIKHGHVYRHFKSKRRDGNFRRNHGSFGNQQRRWNGKPHGNNPRNRGFNGGGGKRHSQNGGKFGRR